MLDAQPEIQIFNLLSESYVICIVVKEQFLHSTWLNGTFDLSTVHNNFSFLTNGLVFR